MTFFQMLFPFKIFHNEEWEIARTNTFKTYYKYTPVYIAILLGFIFNLISDYLYLVDLSFFAATILIAAFLWMSLFNFIFRKKLNTYDKQDYEDGTMFEGVTLTFLALSFSIALVLLITGSFASSFSLFTLSSVFSYIPIPFILLSLIA